MNIEIENVLGRQPSSSKEAFKQISSIKYYMKCKVGNVSLRKNTKYQYRS